MSEWLSRLLFFLPTDGQLRAWSRFKWHRAFAGGWPYAIWRATRTRGWRVRCPDCRRVVEGGG